MKEIMDKNKSVLELVDELTYDRFMMSEVIFRTKLAIILQKVRMEEKEKEKR